MIGQSNRSGLSFRAVLFRVAGPVRQHQLVKDHEVDNRRVQWSCVGDIPDFPVESFEELQAVVSEKKYRLGVDSLAAARWSERLASGYRKLGVNLLSVLLIAAAAASVITALWTRDYWLLAAIPIMAASFYFSDPSSRIATWVTVGGAVSVVAFFNLLLNGLIDAATLVAYAGLTFAAVRAAAFINNSSFRRALMSDEALFVIAYQNGACSVRKGKDGMVYSYGVKGRE